jgi:chemotaxis protein CheZ
MQTSESTLRAAIREEMSPLFADLRCFLDRRISEVSVEVHGATQLLGLSEDNLSDQLGKLHEQVAQMIAAPSVTTPNSGIELETVVQTTEAAANQIMEAAEAISDCLRTALPDRQMMATINALITAIFEACAFQDLTGQRLRRAIEHLRHVESALSGMKAGAGDATPVFPPQAPTVASSEADQGQAEIDAMFA